MYSMYPKPSLQSALTQFFASQMSNRTDNGKHLSAHVCKHHPDTYRWTSVHMAMIRNVCTPTHPNTHTHRLFSRIFWIQWIISSICWVAPLVSEPVELPVDAYEKLKAPVFLRENKSKTFVSSLLPQISQCTDLGARDAFVSQQPIRGEFPQSTAVANSKYNNKLITTT